MTGRARAEYYISCVALASEGLYQPEPTLLLQWLRSQHPRIISALDWCLAEPEENLLGLELGAVLWTFWTFSGYLMEGQEKLTALLRQDTNPSPSWARGRVCLGLGKLSLLSGDYEQAVIHYDEAHKIGTLLHDKVLRADSLIGEGEAVLSSDGFPDSLSVFRARAPPFGSFRRAARCFQMLPSNGDRAISNGRLRRRFDLWTLLSR